MQKLNVQNWVLIILMAVFFVLVVLLLKPFFTIILWAAIFLTFASPIYRHLSGEARAARGGRFPRIARRAAAAALVSVGSVLAVMLPLAFLAFLLMRQSGQLLGAVLAFVQNPSGPFSGEAGMRAFLGRFWPGLLDQQAFDDVRRILLEWTGGRIDLGRVDVKALAMEFLLSNQARLVTISTRAARGLGAFLVSLAFMIFTLYFFLMDGAYLQSIFRKAVPIKSEYMANLMKCFRETTRRLVLGNILVALVQGAIAFILFASFQVPGALLLACLLAACSFIPMVGTGLVWFPVGVLYAVLRDPFLGILLTALSATLVSLLDNFYRPILVGGPISLHPLPLFFAIVGGVSFFGVNGLIIGPLILVLFFSVLDIFRGAYGMGKELKTEAPGQEQGLSGEPAEREADPAAGRPAEKPGRASRSSGLA